MYESIISAYESSETENPKIIHTHTVGYNNILPSHTPWSPWHNWVNTPSKLSLWNTMPSTNHKTHDELDDVVKSSPTLSKFAKSSANSKLLLLVRKLAKDHTWLRLNLNLINQIF